MERPCYKDCEDCGENDGHGPCFWGDCVDDAKLDGEQCRCYAGWEGACRCHARFDALAALCEVRPAGWMWPEFLCCAMVEPAVLMLLHCKTARATVRRRRGLSQLELPGTGARVQRWFFRIEQEWCASKLSALRLAGPLCGQKEGCAHAFATRLPTCAGIAVRGERCAGKDPQTGALYTRSCESSSALALACARVPGALEATCVTASEAQSMIVHRCTDAGSGALPPPLEAATPPPAAVTAPPPGAYDASDVGVCCGLGHVFGMGDDGASECCGWDVDQQGSCCHTVDACNVCDGPAKHRDADGALLVHKHVPLAARMRGGAAAPGAVSQKERLALRGSSMCKGELKRAGSCARVKPCGLPNMAMWRTALA